MKDGFDIPEVEVLGEDRLALIREAAEKSRGKEGMARLDVLLEYGEKLAAGGTLPKGEQRALVAAIGATLPKGEQQQLLQMMTMMGL